MRKRDAHYRIQGGKKIYEACDVPRIGEAVILWQDDGVHPVGTYEVLMVNWISSIDWVDATIVVAPREDMWWQS